MKKLIFILFISLSLSATAQRVVSSAAGQVQGVSWTIGEIVTQTIAGDVFVLQGFNQPTAADFTGMGETLSGMTLSVYPNPVINTLTIELETPGSYTWQLTDLTGRRLMAATVAEANQASVVNMEAYRAGNYLLTVTSQQETKSIIIIKK